jgi:hypothetical protein
VFQVVPKPKATATVSSESKPKEIITVSLEPKPEETPPEAKEKEQEIKDRKKPEKFEILVSEDFRVFDGKKFISFFSTDKDSGVDHYEIREGKGDYKIAQSPYLLDDQNLGTVIRVRAYDFSGNYRESVYPNIFKRILWWISSRFSS